jgi:hypothetical protein
VVSHGHVRVLRVTCEGGKHSSSHFLSKKHKDRHLKWAKAHQHWTANDWKTVIFSDESKFNLFGSDGCRWCWRKPGEQFDERYVRKEVKHGGGNVMVWGCITTEGLGRLVRIQGNMDAKLYVSILDDDVLGTLKDLGINKKDIYSIFNRTMT